MVFNENGRAFSGLRHTSMSTVRPSSARRQLYIYGVNGAVVTESADGNIFSRGGFAAGTTQAAPTTTAREEQGYVVSDNEGAVELRPLGETGEYPVRSIPIPALRTVEGAGRSAVVKDWSTGVLSVVTPSPEFVVVAYKDVCVFRLDVVTSTRWVMVLARLRTWTNDGESRPNTAPYQSAADIVAFTADDAAFSSGVRGPVLLVSGIDAVPGQTERAWLGVPSAIQVDNTVYLYYQVERQVDPDTGTDYAVGLGDRSPMVGSFEGGIAVRQINAAVLAQALGSAPTTPGADDAWEQAASSYPEVTVSGVNLGSVRVWMAWPYGPLKKVISFAEAWANEDGGSPRLADPSVVRCGDALVLFFSAIGNKLERVRVAPNSGFGIWRSSALDPGPLLVEGGGSSVTAVRGVDFVVRWGTTDQVADSTSETTLIDPDAVRLRSGSWLIHFGQDYATESYAWTELWLSVLAHDDDVCIDPADCWDLQEPAWAEQGAVYAVPGPPGVDRTQFVAPLIQGVVWPSSS